ncbi:sugar ABC transporter permease [Nonomuraea sp. NPDC050691]|uniref:carbohydrate ABC transporter permease n=1 Tax=Nonomuraea sp. NPDC050691 TaxID=3155661 RepID=UPI0033FB3CB9
MTLQLSRPSAGSRHASAARSGRRGPRRGWLFVVPALFFYGLVVLYPSVAGAVYAFTDWSGLGSQVNPVGLANFGRLLGDAEAVGSLWNTLLLAVALMIVQNVIGLALALALDTAIRGRNLLRTLFFAPAVLPPLVIGVLWKYVYSPGGPLDGLLAAFGLEGLQQSWLGDESLALWSVVVAIVWQHAGLSMVIFLAGLQGVPKELYEAAALDGASRRQRFRYVTLPLLAPATTITLVLTMITGLKLFDQVFAMTGGGPGYATETLSLNMYKQAFVLNDYSYGTALALVLTMIVAFISFLQLKVLRRLEVEA